MKRLNETLLIIAIFIQFLAIALIIFSIFNFFPDTWKKWVNVVAIIAIGKSVIEGCFLLTEKINKS
jgi:hypothetical protein